MSDFMNREEFPVPPPDCPVDAKEEVITELDMYGDIPCIVRKVVTVALFLVLMPTPHMFAAGIKGGVSIDLDITPLIARTLGRIHDRNDCNISTVGFRFFGTPGQQFRSDRTGQRFTAGDSGRVELLALRRHGEDETFSSDGLSLVISPLGDQFGFRDVELPEAPLPKVTPRMHPNIYSSVTPSRHYRGDPSDRWTMTRSADGYPVWHEHQSWRGYALMYVLKIAATATDIESTRRAERRNPDGKEGNPVARFIIDRAGYNGLRGFGFSLDIIQMEVARRRKRQHEHWLASPLISSGVHLGGAAWNSQVNK